MDAVIEISKHIIERLVRASPLLTDAAGNVLDILDPPFALAGIAPSPMGPVSYQVFVTALAVQPIPGTNLGALVLTFDNSSVQPLSATTGASRLAGTLRVTATAAFQPTGVAGIAQLGVDFSWAIVKLDFTGPSRDEIANAGAPRTADELIGTVENALQDSWRTRAFQQFGLPVTVTSNIASEDLFTVTSLPTVIFPDAERLLIGLTFVRDLPGLISGDLFPNALDLSREDAVALTLTPRGFAQVVRNPAVRGLARTAVADNHRAEMVQKAKIFNANQGETTQDDRNLAEMFIQSFLTGQQGRDEIDAQTPPPTGNGKLRRHVSDVPAPFGAFDTDTYHLDMDLGQDKIIGHSKARGDVNGFGFDATGSFTAVPVITVNPANNQTRVELADVHVDRPSVSIKLPPWLQWAEGILVSLLAGPVMGVISVVLLNLLADGLGDDLVTQKSLDERRDELAKAGQNLRVPANIRFSAVSVTSAAFVARGRWSVRIDDPRPFVQDLQITAATKRTTRTDFIDMQSTAWVACMGIFGKVVASTEEGGGTRFNYTRGFWDTALTLTPAPINLPLPMVYHGWSIRVGYRQPTQYHLPVLGTAVHPLSPGVITVTSDVWVPEPIFEGSIVKRTFDIRVSGNNSSGWTLQVPAEASNIIVRVELSGTDATGKRWEAVEVIDITGQTVAFGADFVEFQKECGKHSKTVAIPGEASGLDPLWNPPNVYFDLIQRAARQAHPDLLPAVTALIEEHGLPAVVRMLNPAKLQRRR